jgi:hypothetical protein
VKVAELIKSENKPNFQVLQLNISKSDKYNTGKKLALCLEPLYVLTTSVITGMKTSKRMRWTGHVVRMSKTEKV